jgi:diguanylate cyclase (GGDEF)-like protein
LPDAVYREFIDTLFDMSLPVAAMGLALVSVAGMIAVTWGDQAIGALTIAAAIVTVARLILIRAYRNRGEPGERPALRRWELRYAIGNYVFAALLGAFNLRLLMLHLPIVHMIGVSLVFGFGAGVVARISIRPRICVTSLLLATVPTVLGLAYHAFTHNDARLHAQLFAAEALLVAITTALSLDTVNHLYTAAVRHLTTKHDLASLATQDALTGLPNRLLLRERFQHAIGLMTGVGGQVALHFLDLDGFKAINDRHGHLAGDEILKRVAARLTTMVRSSDTVARLGGDEFIVIQSLSHQGEAEMLGRRIVKVLSAPYEIGGETMHISVSIGIAVAPDQGIAFDNLTAAADAALYRSKAGGKGQIQFCTREDMTAGTRAVA